MMVKTTVTAARIQYTALPPPASALCGATTHGLKNVVVNSSPTIGNKDAIMQSIEIRLHTARRNQMVLPAAIACVALSVSYPLL